MHSLNEILVPIDFSPPGDDAARCAAAVARYFKSRITLLHVVPPIDPVWAATGIGGGPLEEVLAHQKEEICSSVQRFLAEELRDLAVKRIVCEGDPAQVISSYCASERVGLVMMPTRGCSAWRRFFLGSVTAKVLNEVNCPVWTSSHASSSGAAGSAVPKSIVCAIHSIPAADAISNWAAEAASGLGARLIVVHAVPSFKFPSEGHYPAGDAHWSVIEEERSRILKGLRRSRLPAAEVRVEAGNVSTVVRSVVEESRADLLVIGRASDAGVLGHMRTHSYTLIRESPCPVISI